MNWEAIGAIGEVLGAAGVILTLGYLAFQIRQNNRHLAQEAQRARAHAVRENLGVISNNAELMVKEGSGEALSAVEALQMDTQWMRALFSYQTSFQQLPRNEIKAHLNYFRSMLETSPSLRATWEQRRETFQPDFIQYMDENVFNER